MRLCVILLFVVVGLWLSGIFAGSCQDNDRQVSPNDAPKIFERIRSWMPDPLPMGKHDLEPTPCLQFPYLRTPASGVCAVSVSKGEQTRGMVLEVAEGTARVTFTDNRRPDKSASTDLPTEIDGETTEQVELQVSSEGGELNVRCRGGKACAVRFARKPVD